MSNPLKQTSVFVGAVPPWLPQSVGAFQCMLRKAAIRERFRTLLPPGWRRYEGDHPYSFKIEMLPSQYGAIATLFLTVRGGIAPTVFVRQLRGFDIILSLALSENAQVIPF